MNALSYTFGPAQPICNLAVNVIAFIIIFPNLVDIIVIDSLIKQAVEIVEEVDDLLGCAFRGDLGEGDDVAEENGGVVKHLWFGHLVDDVHNYEPEVMMMASILKMIVRMITSMMMMTIINRKQ